MTGRPRAAVTGRLVLRVLVLVVFLAGVAFMAVGSLRGVGEPAPRGFELVPPGLGTSAYRELAERLPLGLLLRNSTLVVAVAVPVAVVVASWAGFALAQLPRRRRRVLVGATVALLVVPLPAVWVARFALFVQLGVLDTLVPLVAPAFAASTPFTVLLAYRAFRRLPGEHVEAARLEGASALRTWWSVALPQVRPTTLAIAAIAFALHWGAYLDALLYVQAADLRTLPLGVAELTDLDGSEVSVLLAGAFLLTLPPLLALGLVQRPLFSAADPVARS